MRIHVDFVDFVDFVGFVGGREEGGTRRGGESD